MSKSQGLKPTGRNGTEYRTTETGYILKKGKREIYINAKSVLAGQKARDLIGNKSFNQIFSMGKKISLFGANASHIYL